MAKSYITMENHNFSWVNPRFLWPCSASFLALATLAKREARRQIWRLEKSSLAPAQAALGWDALVWRLPPGNQQFAIENGPFIVMVDLEWIYPLKIVDLPIENGDL